jgi:hypothetical protein
MEHITEKLHGIDRKMGLALHTQVGDRAKLSASNKGSNKCIEGALLPTAFGHAFSTPMQMN